MVRINGSTDRRITLNPKSLQNLEYLAKYVESQNEDSLHKMVLEGNFEWGVSTSSLIRFAINFTHEMLVNAPEQDYQKRLEELRTKGADVGNNQKTTTSLEYKDLKPLFNNNELQTYLLLSIYQMIMDPNWVIGELTSYHGEQEDNTQRELIGKISQLIQMDTARGQTIKSTRQNKKKHRNNQ